MDKPQRYTSTVIRHHQLSTRGFELELSREGLPFQAGQLVTLHGRDITEDRSYSIASGEDDPTIHVLYDLIPDGTLTPQLRLLKEGDSIDISGPYGQFVLRDLQVPIIFVATGTGVAPCRSFIRSHPDLNIRLIMGVRTQEELYYREELEAFPFTPCISRDGKTDCPARVTDVFQAWQDDGKSHYYLCGAFSMIFDVNALLRDKGIDDSRIFTEEYYYQSESE